MTEKDNVVQMPQKHATNGLHHIQSGIKNICKRDKAHQKCFNKIYIKLQRNSINEDTTLYETIAHIIDKAGYGDITPLYTIVTNGVDVDAVKRYNKNKKRQEYNLDELKKIGYDNAAITECKKQIGLVYDEYLLPNDQSAEVHKALRHIGYDIRKDIQHAEIEIKMVGKDWQILEEDMEGKVQDDLLKYCVMPRGDKMFPASFSQPAWNRIVKSICYDNTVHKYMEWLEKVRQTTTYDLDYDIRERTFIDIFNVEDNAFNREIGLIFWKILVYRTMCKNPKGIRFPFVYVLHSSSDQGVGKSAFVQNLLPEELDSTGDIEYTSFGDHKKMIEENAGEVLIECAEMSFKKVDTNKSKALTDKKMLKARKAYGRHATRVKRIDLIVITTNSPDYHLLPYDTSGNRRYLTVNCDIGRDYDGKRFEYIMEWINEFRDKCIKKTMDEFYALSTAEQWSPQIPMSEASLRYQDEMNKKSTSKNQNFEEVVEYIEMNLSSFHVDKDGWLFAIPIDITKAIQLQGNTARNISNTDIKNCLESIGFVYYGRKRIPTRELTAVEKAVGLTDAPTGDKLSSIQRYCHFIHKDKLDKFLAEKEIPIKTK